MHVLVVFWSAFDSNVLNFFTLGGPEQLAPRTAWWRFPTLFNNPSHVLVFYNGQNCLILGHDLPVLTKHRICV